MRSGSQGLLNDAGDKCFIRINPFFGNAITPGVDESTHSTRWGIHRLNIFPETRLSDPTDVGFYLSRSSNFSVSEMTVDGFGIDAKLNYSWLGSFSNCVLSSGYLYNLDLGNGANLNGISFNNCDLTGIGTFYDPDSASVRYGGSRIPFYNCYFEGGHTNAFRITGGRTDLNLFGCFAEFYDKTLVYTTVSSVGVNLFGCTIPNTTLVDSPPDIYYFFRAFGGDLSGSSLKSYAKSIDVSGFSAAISNKQFELHTDLDWNSDLVSLPITRNVKMLQWNISETAIKHYQIYGGGVPGSAISSFIIPPNFIGKKFNFTLTTVGSSNADGYYHATDYVAKYEFDGTAITRLSQNVPDGSNEEMTVELESYDTVKGQINIKFAKLASGSQVLPMIFRMYYSTFDF